MYLPRKDDGDLDWAYGTSAPDTPQVPIYASPPVILKAAQRIILLFGEATQDLGVLAHRVTGGPEGINAGSMVSVVKALAKQTTSTIDGSPPAIVLANAGQLCWWPEGKRALCRSQFNSAPMKSAVHLGRFFHSKLNGIPGNLTVREHIACVFDHVLSLAESSAKLDVIGIGGAAEELEDYLDNASTWTHLGPRISTLSLLGSFYKSSHLTSPGFKHFLKHRARAWVLHDTPLDTLISGAEGNPKAPSTFTDLGCPVFSAGTDTYVEMLLVRAYEAVLDWIQEVAMVGEGYKNPEFKSDYADMVMGLTETWGSEDTNGEEQVRGGQAR
jgi:hypothetical protein